MVSALDGRVIVRVADLHVFEAIPGEIAFFNKDDNGELKSVAKKCGFTIFQHDIFSTDGKPQ